MRTSLFFQSKGVVIFLCMALFAINGFSQSTVTFNVDGATTVIPKEVFGLLMERLGRQWTNNGIFVGTASTIPNTNGMRNDVIEGFKDCGVGAVEWPGGCASNGYAWQNNKKPSNDVGVDRFIQFCQLTGAEAVVAGRPTSADAASNYAFAQYVLDSLKYPLKWFKIGNEVWACGGYQSVSTYMASYTASYTKLKDLKNTVNGKNLNILAAAGAIEGSYDWIPTMFNGIGSTMDGVEYHDYIYYPDNVSSVSPTTANYWTVIRDVLTGDIHTHLYNNVFPAMNSADPSKRIKIALDEWGDWLMDTGDGWMQQITLMDALSAGSHLNMFVQNIDRIAVACLAQGVNVIHSIININTSGVMSKTTTYYVFKLLKPHHTNNAKLAPITASNFQNVTGNGMTMPAVNAAASVDASGFVNISFTNVDLTATRQVTVSLTSSKASYTVKSADVVTGTAHTSFNDFGAAEQVNIKTLAASNYSISGKTLTATLPAMSVVMFRLMPPDTTPTVGVQPVRLLNNRTEAFSIKAGSRGTVLITSSEIRKTPVSISLLGIDGRTIIDKTTRMFGAGSSTCVLGNAEIGNGVYVVKIKGADINLSKQVVISR